MMHKNSSKIVGKLAEKSGKITAGIFGQNRSFPRESACYTRCFWTTFLDKFWSKILNLDKNCPKSEKFAKNFRRIFQNVTNFPGKSDEKKVGKKWGKIQVSGRNKLYFQKIWHLTKNVEKKAQTEPSFEKMVIFGGVDNFGQIREKFPRKFPREFSRKFPRKFPRRFFVEKKM